jgi:hypothetical protein
MHAMMQAHVDRRSTRSDALVASGYKARARSFGGLSAVGLDTRSDALRDLTLVRQRLTVSLAERQLFPYAA